MRVPSKIHIDSHHISLSISYKSDIIKDLTYADRIDGEIIIIKFMKELLKK